MFFDCPYDTHFECYNHKQIYFVKTSSKRLKLRYSYSILFVFIEIFWCHHVARALYLYRKPPKNIPEKTLVLILAKNSCQTLCFSYPRKDDQAIDLIRDIWTVDLKVLVQRKIVPVSCYITTWNIYSNKNLENQEIIIK